MTENSIKCVAVGDGFVGKTTLLMRLCQKEISEDYSPTVFDNYSRNIDYNGQSYEILLIDTAGQEEYNMLRKQVYEYANVFLVCFSVSNTDSFLNVKQTWLPEIEVCPGAGKILIGTKSDLRNDPETIDKLNSSGGLFVSASVATKLAASYNMKYVECSATTKGNMMDEILKTVLEVYKSRSNEKSTGSSSHYCCANAIVRFAKRVLCCKNY